MEKKFDLELFKTGMLARNRAGELVKFIGVCPRCVSQEQLVAYIEGQDYVSLYQLDGTYMDKHPRPRDLVSMVSRHQELIDSYDPLNTYQIDSDEGGDGWTTLKEVPQWLECRDYRLHPHNSLIIAHSNGAKIQVFDYDGANTEQYWHNDPNPTWDTNLKYREHTEPEFTYPIYKKHVNSRLVVMFTDMVTGKVIETNGLYNVGDVISTLVVHTNSDVWEGLPSTKTDDPEVAKTVYEWLLTRHDGSVTLTNTLCSEEVASEEFNDM